MGRVLRRDLDRFGIALFVICSATIADAQRDPPVWDCYLPGITLVNDNAADKLTVDLVFCKNGGPTEHRAHQMYVFAYLAKNEDVILKLARDKKLAEKKKPATGVIDVLKKEGLIASLGTKVALRKEVEMVAQKRLRRVGGYAFEYAFEFNNRTLLKLARGLKNWRKLDPGDRADAMLPDKLKLLIFVPTNDSRYATQVPRKLRATPDFAHFQDHKTSLLYFKPLPYRFQLRRLPSKNRVLSYID